MFLITIDKSGRLLVEQTVFSGNTKPQFSACLPTIPDGSSRDEITAWLIKIGADGASGDKVYQVEHLRNQPSLNSSLRVPARVFRTIRTLTDSAVFIEVQSGPFSDSDTQWAEGTARR